MPDGTTLGGVNGLGPNIANWGAGITLTVPLAEYAGIRTRRDAEIAREQVERARLDQIRRDLQADEERAMAALTAARQIAAEMPQLLTAARDSERQATARYRAGLGNLIEVADAQRVLAQAEIDHALARLAIWRAEFAVARARGDLAPVLREAAR